MATRGFLGRRGGSDAVAERLPPGQFLESGYNNMILTLAQGEALRTSIDWYRGIADQYKVEWIRPPQDQRSM